jgi:predicted ATPase/class 3 adenylate cyclase
MGDISAWLTERGLARYVEAFRDNDIDFDVLRSLSDGELKELGLSLGDRKRLLQAVGSLPLSRGTDASATIDAQGASGPVVNTADRRQLTVLFADLVDSTALSRVLDPEDLRDLIRDYHRAVADAIREAGGFVAKFMGDGVLAYFGYPHASEDAGERSVRAGLQALAAVRGLPTPHGRPVACRVGIATGPVVVGDVTGEDIAREVNVVGETPNLAARLLGIGQPDGVIIAASTRQIIGDLFVLEALTPQLVKGFAEPVVAYQVQGERRGVSRFEATRRHHKGVFVGRSQEVGLLLDRWELAQRGEGQLVMVSGEAGIGKSRITDALWQAVANGPHKRIRFQCTPQHVNSPFYPAVSYALQQADLRPEEGYAAALRRLAEAVVGLSDDQQQLIAGLLGVALPADTPVLAMQPARQRQEVIEGFSRHLEALAATAPLLWVIEDAHWIDPSTEALIGRVLDQVHAHPILIVATQRPDYKAPWVSNPSATLVQLSRLSRAHTTALLERLAGGRSVPPDVVAYIASRADGVPLFVEELFQALCDSGSLREGLKGFELTRALDDQAIPVTLQDSLMARLDRLALAKAVAQIGSTIGREFSPGLLIAVAGMAEGPICEGLRQLEASGLLFSRGSGSDQVYVFKHTLVQEAAYASMLRQRRQEVHGRIAEALEDVGSDACSELLAHHLECAGRFGEAAVQFERAATHARRSGANKESIRQLRRALAALIRLEQGSERDSTSMRLHLQLAAQLLATEGYGADAVLIAYQEAERLSDGLDDDMARFKVEMGLSAYRLMRADFSLALAHGERAAAIAVRSNDIKQRLQAHWSQACVLFHQGRLRASSREMETALSLYVPAMHSQFGLQDPGLMCMAYSSWGLWEQGRPDAALVRIGQAVSIADAFQHRFSQAVALSYTVSVELLRGETEAALAHAERCARVCDEHGFPVWLAITRCMSGYLQCELGHFDRGLAEIDAGYAQWLATGARVSQPLFLALQAQGLMLAGELAVAESRVVEGLAIVEQLGEIQLEAELTRLRGVLRLRSGAVADGEAWLRLAYGRALRQHRLGFALRSANDLARLWMTQGRRDAALRLLDPLVARWREGQETRDLRVSASLLESLRAN